MLAFSRPFWPLFLHVLGAMTLYGALIAATVVAVAGHARATLSSLAIAVPAWLVTLAGALWIAHDEALGNSNATWIGIGHLVLEPGVLILLASIGCAFWWTRSGKAVAGRVVAGLSLAYLALLTVALLAMSGKWG